jgi:hypothetical protein
MMSCLCIAGVSQAQVQVTLKLDNPGNNISNGVYVGPYTLQLNRAGDIQAVCDDRNTEINSSTWTANVNTFATLSSTKFYKSSTPALAMQSTENYEAAAWLVQQMFAIGPSNPANYTTVADIHLALWSVFSSNPSSMLGSNTDAQNWYTAGLGHETDPISEFSDIIIYTPDPKSASQEMMMIAPEPASMILFGTGLLAIGTAIRRRPRSVAPA